MSKQGAALHSAAGFWQFVAVVSGWEAIFSWPLMPIVCWPFLAVCLSLGFTHLLAYEVSSLGPQRGVLLAWVLNVEKNLSVFLCLRQVSEVFFFRSCSLSVFAAVCTPLVARQAFSNCSRIDNCVSCLRSFGCLCPVFTRISRSWTRPWVGSATSMISVPPHGLQVASKCSTLEFCLHFCFHLSP